MNSQYTMYLFIGIAFLCVVVLGIIIRYQNKKFQQEVANFPDVLPEAYGLGQKMFPVHLKCADLKQAYFIVSLVFNLVNILMLVMLIGELDPYDSLPYPKIVDAILTKEVILPIAIAVGILFIYNAYHRINVTWENGPVVADDLINVKHYQIKKDALLLNVIYLQTDQKLWILVPGTSQDFKKFKDFNQLSRDQQENEKYVQQLQENLIHYGAQEKKFPFLTVYFKFSFFILTLTVILILVVLKSS